MNCGRSSNPRVLVIDDAVATRERLCQWLAEEGLEAVGCSAAHAEALARFEQIRPDCIVIDVPMHDRTGFELLAELRSLCSDCRLIVLVHDVSDEIRRRCADLGAQHCIDKTVDFDRVAALARARGTCP